MTDLPREKLFCPKCGTKLQLDGRILGYDEYTGQAIQATGGTKICKNRLCKNSPLYISKERE